MTIPHRSPHVREELGADILVVVLACSLQFLGPHDANGPAWEEDFHRFAPRRLGDVSKHGIDLANAVLGLGIAQVVQGKKPSDVHLRIGLVDSIEHLRPAAGIEALDLRQLPFNVKALLRRARGVIEAVLGRKGFGSGLKGLPSIRRPHPQSPILFAPVPQVELGHKMMGLAAPTGLHSIQQSG